MKVYIQMPTDTPFKSGDIFLERGFRITVADSDGKAVHEDIKDVFFRPADNDVADGTDQAKIVQLSDKLRSIAKEVASL